MKIKMNGEDYIHPDEDCTLSQVLIVYLSRENIEQVRGIAVAMNGSLVRKSQTHLRALQSRCRWKKPVAH